MNPKLNAIELGRALIRCESVTPNDGGALGVLKDALEEIGFTCQIKIFADDGTPDAFVHITAVERAGLATPHRSGREDHERTTRIERDVDRPENARMDHGLF